MRIQWFGHSAFLLAGQRSVFIDPFGPPLASMTERGNHFTYPPIRDVSTDLVLISHEHFDHNALERIDGQPAVIRSTAGRLQSPVGEVVAIASEHDELAGTARGPNSILVFTLDGSRVCHFGDFGQSGLRDEQREAIGSVDVLLLPVGGESTIDGAAAAAIARALEPAVVIPMHYANRHVNWLEPVDGFLSALDWPVLTVGAHANRADLAAADAPQVVLFAAP